MRQHTFQEFIRSHYLVMAVATMLVLFACSHKDHFAGRKWEPTVAEAPFGSDAWLEEVSWLYNFSEPGITNLNAYQHKSEFLITFERGNHKSALLFFRKAVVRIPYNEIVVVPNGMVVDGDSFVFRSSGTAYPSIHGAMKARSKLAE